MLIAKNRIVADDEIDVDVTEPIDDVDIDVEDKGSEINVDEAATELLFETEDVAELIAEVAGEPVDVTVEDSGEVRFAVGDNEFTVSPEGDEELLEASTRIMGRRRPIRASARGSVRRPAARRPQRSAVKASTASRRAARRARK